MEGPTPVSALIHAATMVTAGVFLVARCNAIFNLSPVAMNVVAVVGAVTSIFAATIAFFKALMFLAAGSVIHAVHHNDIQRMGGLKKYMPITYITMFIAALSAGGVPGLAGFFSKDEIIWSAFASGSPVGKFVWLLVTGVAFFTPFYSFRMIFLTFHSKFRGTHHEEHHLHESPSVITIPLIILAAGAIGDDGRDGRLPVV